MTNSKKSNSESENKVKLDTEKISDNSGIRSAQIDTDPAIGLEEARNANEGKAANGAGGNASSTAEEYVPSSSEPEASNLPSSDKTH